MMKGKINDNDKAAQQEDKHATAQTAALLKEPLELDADPTLIRHVVVKGPSCLPAPIEEHNCEGVFRSLPRSKF